MALGFRLYTEAALEYATSHAARLLAVDTTRSRSSNAASFQAVTFCPLLAPFLSCNNVTVSLQPCSPDFRTGCTASASARPPFTNGGSGSLMLLQARYSLPTSGWLMNFQGTTVTVKYAYQNEY